MNNCTSIYTNGIPWGDICSNAIGCAMNAQWQLILTAAFGGLVLFVFNMVEHAKRPPEHKWSLRLYCVAFILQMLGLPFLGGTITAIYLANGDKLSCLLAFQVGLTSPWIIQGMISSAMARAAKHEIPLPKGA